jgi:hypothetical protein
MQVPYHRHAPYDRTGSQNSVLIHTLRLGVCDAIIADFCVSQANHFHGDISSIVL